MKRRLLAHVLLDAFGQLAEVRAGLPIGTPNLLRLFKPCPCHDYSMSLLLAIKWLAFRHLPVDSRAAKFLCCTGHSLSTLVGDSLALGIF